VSDATDCVFCRRIGRGEVELVTLDIVTFEPLNPVTPGHRLFVPIRHSPDFLHGGGAHDLGRSMEAAATWHSRWGGGTDANLIVSAGSAATQTIKHLHVHLVPRRAGDELTLPWTGQQAEWKAPA
jgi:histidine triad (HIT) family protein